MDKIVIKGLDTRSRSILLMLRSVDEYDDVRFAVWTFWSKLNYGLLTG